MKTRDEEIKQATEIAWTRVPDIIKNDFIKRTVFNQGAYELAKWADEHPRNQWKDAKNDPPKDMKPVIGYADGWICLYEYSPEEKIWSVGLFICDAPVYWMPVPELPKGGKV